MNMSVSIIGAGHCGCAFAADLMNQGNQVLLYAHPNHCRNLDAIEQNGYLEAEIKINGRFSPKISKNIEDAIRFSKFIIITVPSHGHDDILNELESFDLSQHIIIAITGNFFSLAAQQRINAQAILETSTSPFASRMQDGKVLVIGIKKILPVAFFPSLLSSTLRGQISSIFSMPLEWHDNVLEIGMSCITGVIHPTPAIMNTGWIETTKGDFYFYREGMSASVSEVIEKIDKERMAISQALGLETQSIVSIMNKYYGSNFTNFTDFSRGTAEHNSVKMTPHHMRDRFIVQDVPYVLVPWYELGLKVGVESMTIRSIIQLASIINQTDYMETGRNLRKLGLSTASSREMLEFAGATRRFQIMRDPGPPELDHTV